MPVVDAVIMPVFSDNGERVGAYGNDIVEARRWCIPQLDVEHLRTRLGLHILVPAAAGGAGAGCPQQLERIDACVIIVPRDCEFSGLLIGSNASWFFVHGQFFFFPRSSIILALEHTTKSLPPPSRRVTHHRVRRDTTRRTRPLHADRPGRQTLLNHKQGIETPRPAPARRGCEAPVPPCR